jgi:hypothetical protein
MNAWALLTVVLELQAACQGAPAPVAPSPGFTPTVEVSGTISAFDMVPAQGTVNRARA